MKRILVALLGSLALVAAGCTSSASPTPSASASVAPVKLTVGLGYIPGVQFAPFYLAQQSGAYAAAGLEVTLQNQIDPDLISLVGSGGLDLALADGTSMIPAVSQGIPVRYLATIYGVLPNVVIARTDAGIMSPADLKGKRVGTPGQYGSGYLTLLGILDEASLSIGDVSLDLYPDFGQTQALISGAADATTGYANNDLVQAQAAGVEVEVTLDSAYLLRDYTDNKRKNSRELIIPHILSDPYSSIGVTDNFSMQKAIHTIAKSKFVLSGAMHGCILAHMAGVPWAPYVGSDWYIDCPDKWYDWFESIGIPADDLRFCRTLEEGKAWYENYGSKASL